MATYVYETIPEVEGGEVRTYEIKQSMKDAALAVHPETGEKIRRVITGGFGLMGVTKRAEEMPSMTAPAMGGHCCGGGCGCG